MYFIIFVLLILSVFLGTRLFYVEKQVQNLTNQLTDINDNKVDKNITIGLMNRNIEKLSIEINGIIQARKQSEANKIKQENDLRETIASMSHDLRTAFNINYRIYSIFKT